MPDFHPAQRLHVPGSPDPDPTGPYTFGADPGNTREPDPGVLWVNDRLYPLGSHMDGTQSLSGIPLSNPWSIRGPATINSPTHARELRTHPVNEGAEPLHHNGRTMIVHSAGACWRPDHKLGLLTLIGNDPLNRDPRTRHPPPVLQRSDANGVYAPGHNGFFKSPDDTEDRIVYHANSSASGGCDMTRSTRARKFTRNADGTPTSAPGTHRRHPDRGRPSRPPAHGLRRPWPGPLRRLRPTPRNVSHGPGWPPSRASTVRPTGPRVPPGEVADHTEDHHGGPRGTRRLRGSPRPPPIRSHPRGQGSGRANMEMIVVIG
ncbi:family 43 glycosylhydrolase [Streptomyces sp. ST2-7A]|uniref:family 43 glycosylhydrolase n=1 Tax=Streptomyces sp. ST2-7A TaxID=2907214 RepID=UPI0035AB9C10